MYKRYAQQHPRLRKTEDFLSVILEGLTPVLSRLARIERLVRNESPRGILPSTITARPKGRGLVPRHELWTD